jgi:hypothetical protein
LKTFKANIEVNTPIDNVWYIIDGSEEHLKKLDPKIVKNEVIEEKEGRIGSTYLQEYKEGKRVMEYVVEVLDYKETDDSKMFMIGFNIGGAMEVTARYDLKVVDSTHTDVTYTVTNNPLTLMYKIMMKLMPSSSSVMTKHLEKVKNLSEEAYKNGE